jgi:hypothetical protein
MSLKVVGAGLGRTGTHSLKLALEQLLGGPCYHMLEVIGHPEHVPVWHRAIKGEQVDWDVLFAGYAAAVDWPEVTMWRELHAAYPDAPVLLSVRDSIEAWWKSFSQTILEVMQKPPPDPDDPWFAMSTDMLRRFSPDGMDPDSLKAAYERHNQSVRDAVPAGQLIEWRPRDGWGPICAGLGMAVPAEDFPHVNTTDDFRAMLGLTAGT